MRTFLVTGGAGFIGSHIVEALVRRGDRVRVVDNLCTGFKHNLTQFGDKVELLPIAPKRGLFALPRFGLSALSGDIAATIEDRSVWARLGL